MMTSTGGDHVAHMRSAMCADWPSSFRAEEGNGGLVGNNTPVFLVREPLQFSDFIHAQKLRRSGFHRLSL